MSGPVALSTTEAAHNQVASLVSVWPRRLPYLSRRCPKKRGLSHQTAEWAAVSPQSRAARRVWAPSVPQPAHSGTGDGRRRWGSVPRNVAGVPRRSEVSGATGQRGQREERRAQALAPAGLCTDVTRQREVP